MELYIFFLNDAILDGVAPPEGFWEDQLETTISGSAQPAPTDPTLKRLPQRKQLPLEGLRRSPVPPRPSVRSLPGG